jgi:GT2 family glycosyltransferase
MPTVSVLIPCYREQEFIRACLESVQAFDDPGGSLSEILVLDGMSDDGTREVVIEMSRGDPRIRLLDNTARTQSHALNIGIRVASGDFILRLDAHSRYPGDYLVLALETATRTGADNTGGVLATLRRGTGYQSALVQAITTHRFGVGDSGFRTDAREGRSDTVPYGLFKRRVFDEVGYFDERLVRAQDYEMNRRITAAGGVVWMNPAMKVHYFQQPDLRSFMRKQIVNEAPYNAYMWYLAPYAFAPRHAATAVFSAGVIGGTILALLFNPIAWILTAVLSLYFVLALLSGVQQAARYREPRHVIFAPPAFFLYHFLHGIGVLAGLVRLAVGVSPVQRVREPWPGAGRFRAWPVTAHARDSGAAAIPG